MLKKFLCACCLISLPLSLFSNDTAGTILPTGGVVFEKQDGIKMKTEALYIRPGQIEVNYLFKNTTDKDITTQIFFPLPDMPAVEEYLGDEAHDYHFKLWVNGKPKTYQTHWAVIQNNQDITSDVSILFYRLEEVITDRELAQRIQTLPDETRTKLQDKKIIEWGWALDRKNGEIQTWKMPDDAAWQKQISYSWQQTFPARQTIAVRHTYTPTAIYNNEGTPFSSCINRKDEEYQKFIYIPENESKKYWPHLRARNYLEYILTTANNWQGSIESFNLLVESPLKSAGCFDNEEFYAEQYYAVNRHNYTPRGDLSVDFIVKEDISHNYAPKSNPVLYRIDGPANLRDKPNGKITAQLADKTYVWVWPDEKRGKWYPVRQNESVGYTHANNLIKVF
ncbi:MAG: DUF4424 family protein [Elusimicrobiaceae bacterium]|nr:DUF4424 family protein [Elusimicrobiaceae bacterium]